MEKVENTRCMVKCDIRWNIGNDFRSNYGQIKSAVSRKNILPIQSRYCREWIGRLLSFLIIGYFLTTSAFQIRSMAEVISFFFARRNPTWAIVMPFMWIGLYLIMGGINSIARMFEIIFLLLFLFFNHFLYEYRNIRDDNLRPVLGLGIKPVLDGIKTTLSHIQVLKLC